MSAYDLPPLHRGADYTFEFYWKWQCRDDGVVTEQIVDVTGYTALLQFRRKAKFPAVLSLSVGSGITVTGAEGKFAVTITDSQMDALDPGQYEYDLVVTSPVGVTTVLLFGKARILDRVSR